MFLRPRLLRPEAETADDIIRRFTINRVGRMFAAAHQDRTIRLYDARDCQEVQRITDDFLCTALAFSPRSDVIASGGVDRVIKVWDVRSAELICRLEGHRYPILSLAFSPDCDRLVSSSGDTTLMVWDIGSSKPLRQLKGHSLYVVSCDWDPRGDRIVSGGVDAMIGLWDPTTGERIEWLQEHRSALHQVRFSRDGTRVASASSDQTVMVWDASDGQLRHEKTLTGHTQEVRCVGFNHDGSLIASGSADKNIFLWRTSDFTRQAETMTRGEPDSLEWVADSNEFLTCESTGAIRRWEIVDRTAMIEPLQALLREIESDTAGERRVDLVRRFESLMSQYGSEVLQDKTIFYIVWQCKKHLGLLKGQPV